MIDVIDSIMQIVKDPLGIVSDYKKIFWHEIPVDQKMLKPVTRYSQSATGYGSKLPTDRMINYRGRWHRIYCMIYSNSGTLYFVSGGKRIIVD